MNKGAWAVLEVSGDEHPDIFSKIITEQEPISPIMEHKNNSPFINLLHYPFMNINQQTETFIISAQSKALATYGENLNVVPLSSVKIVNGKIWLVNYFMDKTLLNILANPSVSLVCWSEMIGFK
jgi:hypothetical protein